MILQLCRNNDWHNMDEVFKKPLIECMVQLSRERETADLHRLLSKLNK